MTTKSTRFTLLSHIKSIKMPVFQLIFFSSVTYLGYIFYQDYRYKKLLQQIQNQSKTKTVNPLKGVSNIMEKISSAETKRQLRFFLKDLENNVEKYWVDPHKVQNVIDFEMKQLQKSQQDKKIWWLKPYVSLTKLKTSLYHQSSLKKQGTFGLFFWTNSKVEEKNEILQGKTIRELIQKAIKLRNKKCIDLSMQKDGKLFQNYDMEILDCLKETSKEVACLETMKQRIKIIEQNQLK